MAVTIRRIECYETTVKDLPGEGYRVLALLQAKGVNLLAFSAVPMSADLTRLSLFPQESDVLRRVAQDASLPLSGPQRAFLVQGDDRLGALADIHRRVYEANVNIMASWGVTDGIGGYGYVLYVRREHYEEAAATLGV